MSYGRSLHNHDCKTCPRCQYTKELIGWFQVENRRLTIQFRKTEDARRGQERDLRGLNRDLWRAVGIMSSVLDREVGDWAAGKNSEQIEQAVAEVFAVMDSRKKKRAAVDTHQDEA